MSLRGDDRAQTVQIGAVLLFATLIIAASLYQATVIPAQNQGVEYDAYQDASSDLTALRNTMLSAASGDGTRAVTVKTGAQYPSHVFFINPLQPSGTVATTPPGNVTIGNVSAAPSEFRNAGRYVDAEANALNYTTRRVRFTPDYNELTAAPIVLNNGFVFREHRRPTPLAGQTLVHGNTITLTTVVGGLDASGYTAPVTAVPVSAHVNTVTVTNTSDPLTLTVPTQLNASEWENTVLSGQTGQYVAAVHPGPRPNTVTVEMERGETYELNVARIELKERDDDPEAADPPARYLVTHTDRQTRTNNDGRVKLVVEARDALNNPVSNAPVTFSSSAGKFETQTGENLTQTATVRSNGDGEAIVYFNGTNYVGNLPVTAKLGTGGSVTDEKRVQYQVTNTVTTTGGGGSGEQAGRALVVLEGNTGFDGGNTADTDTQFTINNTGQYPVNVTGYRLDYVTAVASNGQLLDGADAITSVTFDGAATRTGTATESQSPYFFGSDPYELTGGEHTMTINFDQDVKAGRGNKVNGVMLGVSLYLEGGFTVTYTIHVLP